MDEQLLMEHKPNWEELGYHQAIEFPNPYGEDNPNVVKLRNFVKLQPKSFVVYADTEVLNLCSNDQNLCHL